MGLGLKTLTKWEMGWFLIFLGIALVPNLRGDDSMCKKRWVIDGNDPVQIKEAVDASKVSVVMFAKAGCPSSRRQVKELIQWFEGLDKDKRSQSTLSFVNQIGQETDPLTDEIISDKSYSIYQDTDKLSIWKKWKGRKGCIYVIGHCGNMMKMIHHWKKQKVENFFNQAHDKREDDECGDCENPEPHMKNMKKHHS